MSEKIERLIREYPQMKMEQKCLEYQIQDFRGVTEDEMISAMSFSHPEGERVQTGNTSDKTAKIALGFQNRIEKMNEDWYIHLEKEYLKLSKEIRLFESAVRAVPGKAGEVLCDLVFAQMGWEELAEKYYVSQRMIGKYRKKAIKDLELLYQKREEEEMLYLLS